MTVSDPKQIETISSRIGWLVVLTPEVLQQLDLAQCTLRQDLLAEDICDLLDGYALARLVIRGRAAWTTQSV